MGGRQPGTATRLTTAMVRSNLIYLCITIKFVFLMYFHFIMYISFVIKIFLTVQYSLFKRPSLGIFKVGGLKRWVMLGVRIFLKRRKQCWHVWVLPFFHSIDYTFYIYLLLPDVQIQMKYKNKIGETFKPDIGFPQGNCASPPIWLIFW